MFSGESNLPWSDWRWESGVKLSLVFSLSSQHVQGHSRGWEVQRVSWKQPLAGKCRQVWVRSGLLQTSQLYWPRTVHETTAGSQVTSQNLLECSRTQVKHFLLLRWESQPIVRNTDVTLKWSEPIEESRRFGSPTFYTVSCSRCPPDLKRMTVNPHGERVISVTLEGLDPLQSYEVKVYSENSVTRRQPGVAKFITTEFTTQTRGECFTCFTNPLRNFLIFVRISSHCKMAITWLWSHVNFDW